MFMHEMYNQFSPDQHSKDCYDDEIQSTLIPPLLEELKCQYNFEVGKTKLFNIQKNIRTASDD